MALKNVLRFLSHWRWRHGLQGLLIAGVVLLLCLVTCYQLIGASDSTSPITSTSYYSITPDEPETDATEKEIFDESHPLAQDDPRVVNYFRKNYLIPPSKLPYNLVDPTGNPSESEGQNKYVLEILHNKTGGFFIEVGAWDGEQLSTSLLLERDYGWNGFLAEPMKASFEKLVKKNRKAWIANICLSTIKHPQLVNFGVDNFAEGWDSASAIEKYYRGGHKLKIIKTPCFPVFTILSALNIFTVDFFTLDVNGPELEVVKTIPYDKVLIKVFCIEYSWVPEGKYELRRAVERNGFKFVREIKQAKAEDLLFIHNSLV